MIIKINKLKSNLMVQRVSINLQKWFLIEGKMNFINFFFYNNEQSARVEEPDNEGIGCTSRRINVQSHKKFLLIVEKKEK